MLTRRERSSVTQCAGALNVNDPKPASEQKPPSKIADCLSTHTFVKYFSKIRGHPVHAKVLEDDDTRDWHLHKTFGFISWDKLYI